MPSSSTSTSSTRTHIHPSKRQEKREDALITFYARAWEFVDTNKQLVYGVLAGLVVLMLLIAGFFYYRSTQQVAAQERLGRIVSFYEAGDYQMALEGTGDRMGLLDIADEYGGTAAGNLAAFYAADAYYQIGDYERALEFFQSYDAEADILGASAIAAQAAIHENQGAFEEAAARYVEAAEQYESAATAPGYLMSAGRAYEQAGQYDAAVEVYQRVQSAYPDVPAAQEAALLEARAQATGGS